MEPAPCLSWMRSRWALAEPDTIWGFEQFGIVPDIILLGKALGGGLPFGAFIASKKLMDSFTDQPVLGHISTFGGHPLSCAAGLAAMKVLIK